MRLLRSLSIAVALALPAAPAPEARAADPKELFTRGQKQFDGREYEKALETFKEVLASTGSPNARLYVSRCLRELSRLPEAYEEMRAALRDATKRSESEDKYVPTRDAAAAELALLERRVGRVTVSVADPPPGTVVKINGAEIAASRWGEPVAVPVGSVVVIAEAPGRARAERTFEVAGGALQSAAFSFAPEQAPPPPPGGLGSVTVAGLAVGGVGLGGVALGAVLAGLAQARYDELRATCGGRCPDGTYVAAIDEGRALQDGGNAALFVGGGVALVGVVVAIVGTQIKSAAPKAASWAPALRPTPNGFALRF